MVVNSCFEDLDGGVRLKSVQEFVQETERKKNRNERVDVSRKPGFWKFYEEWFLEVCVQPGETGRERRCDKSRGSKIRREVL